MTETPWIPLFPLQVVLLPGALLPLHIYEERYRAMTRRCLSESIAFGVVLVKENSLAQVGCEAAIRRVLRRHDDGRMDLLTQGERRFALLELRPHGDGYLEGRVGFLQDEAEEPEPDARLALLQLLQEHRRLSEEDGEEGAGSPPESGDELEGPGYTFRVAAAVQMDLGERQGLLEMLSERRREQILVRHLARLLPQLRIQNENRRKIRGNGKPLPPV